MNGVGIPLLDSKANMPLDFSILTPVAPASGVLSMNLMQSVMVFSPMMVSGLSNITYSPDEALMAWLFARANPAFSLFAMNFTCGNLGSKYSIEPSELALSVTMTSTWWSLTDFCMELRHCSR